MLIFTWIAACLAMSTFTLLPVVKVEDITQMYALPSPSPLLKRKLTTPVSTAAP